MAVYNAADCRGCIEDGDVVCRNRQDNSISYCCDPNSRNFDYCTSESGSVHALNYDICSNELSRVSMEPFVCPFIEECDPGNTDVLEGNVFYFAYPNAMEKVVGVSGGKFSSL